MAPASGLAIILDITLVSTPPPSSCFLPTCLSDLCTLLDHTILDSATLQVPPEFTGLARVARNERGVVAVIDAGSTGIYKVLHELLGEHCTSYAEGDRVCGDISVPDWLCGCPIYQCWCTAISLLFWRGPAEQIHLLTLLWQSLCLCYIRRSLVPLDVRELLG